MTGRADAVVDEIVATPDPPPTGIPNPIHDAQGADAAGYAGALVAGVRTYGWAVEAVARAIGDDWLDTGWADVTLRRPLFAGERVTITVAPDAERSGAWTIECVADGQGGPRVVLDGWAGGGEATWLGELRPPDPAPGLDPPTVRPTYDLDTVPLRRPLRPLTVHLSAGAAARLATDDLGLPDSPGRARYTDGERPAVHPFFLAARMAPLTRHNFTYGPTIHVRTQIQHRGPARAGQDLTVGARIVDAYDRNDHWYQVLDGIVTGDGDVELARLRHHTIFRPRGTTLPPATGS